MRVQRCENDYLFATLFPLWIAVILVDRVWGSVLFQVLSEELVAYSLHVGRHCMHAWYRKKNEGGAIVTSAADFMQLH